jgi:RNA polymerase sigma-70 factor (ECF subfamily)
MKPSHSNPTDTELTWKIREGDSKSFEEMFFRYSRLLIQFAHRYLRDFHAAENAVQDVFLNVWMNRDRLDPSKNIKTYLYTSVKNQALKHLRQKDVHRHHSEAIQRTYEANHSPDTVYQNREISESVSCAVAELPEKCRTIFEMNRFDHLSYAEIAKILDLSIKTVETQMGRALKFLRKRLAHFVS